MIKQITLIESDFDTLDYTSTAFRDQYEDPEDCPIARSLKRRGIKYFSLGNTYLRIEGVRGTMKGGFEYVAIAAQKIKNGARSAVISHKIGY